MNIWQYGSTYHTKQSLKAKINKTKNLRKQTKKKSNKNKNCIYKIDILGLVYIGQTNNFKARMNEHKENAFNQYSNSYNTKLSQAIRKYGIVCMKISILHKKIKDQDRDKLEILEIAKYDSFENGLNGTTGGRIKLL